MTGLRRHLVAAAWLILSAQTLALALGTARVCWPGEHMHGGVPVPDCSMHHAAEADAASMEHHAHSGHATPPETPSDDGPKMTCRCSSDVMAMYLGQAAILPTTAPTSPVIHEVMLEAASAPSIVDSLFSPPSPPPR